MRDLTRWEVFGLCVLAIGALFYGIGWLQERLPARDNHPDDKRYEHPPNDKPPLA